MIPLFRPSLLPNDQRFFPSPKPNPELHLWGFEDNKKKQRPVPFFHLLLLCLFS